jgi:hypothetical protein
MERLSDPSLKFRLRNALYAAPVSIAAAPVRLIAGIPPDEAVTCVLPARASKVEGALDST